jgi:hypothetical protein
MSKTLWHTIKLEVPKEMINITKNDKVVVKKTLTKTNNISKSNKEPSIKIIPGDTNKPKIINDGKEWNIEELKLKMTKAKELGKKNEGKELKKKSDNKIIKNYVKKVGDKTKNRNSSKEELLIIAKNIISYITHSDQYQSQYEKNWNNKSTDDLLKIINNFKKKYPDIKIKKTPIKMGVFENLGPRL